MFDDQKLGSNEVLALYCFNQALPGQVEHEMLRDIAGTNVNIEKCGPGYVVVSRAGRGVAVVWQVSEQMFVRIDNSHDKEMVAAYVKRLGSIIPKDYKISVDKWVENEIRWRIIQFDERLKWRIENNGPQSVLYGSAPFLTGVFTSTVTDFPSVGVRSSRFSCVGGGQEEGSCRCWMPPRLGRCWPRRTFPPKRCAAVEAG